MPNAPDQLTATGSDDRRNAESPRGGFIGFWVNVWVGIILGGATIGFFVGFPIGSISGAIIFGIISPPFICTSSILSWALWLTRFSLPLAIIAGACSGGFFPILASGMLEPSLAVVAAFAGGLFGGLAAYNYSKKYGWPNRSSNANGKSIWQFSLRDLFLRFTAVSILIAVWTALLAKLLR